MRISTLIVFSLLALASREAVAAVSPACSSPTASGCTLVGKACDTLGQTKMDNDQKGIISCLCSNNANCEAGDLKWAAMGGGTAKSCPRQHVFHQPYPVKKVCNWDGDHCGYSHGWGRHCCWTEYSYGDLTVGPSPNGTVTPSGTITNGNINEATIAVCVDGTWKCIPLAATSSSSLICTGGGMVGCTSYGSTSSGSLSIHDTSTCPSY